MEERNPLLMIPGPVEVSPTVQHAFAVPPPGHLAPPLIEAFGSALAKMRLVWEAEPASQPFVVAGGGTLAMEMAVANLIDPGDRVLLVSTGYFSDRMAEMLRRRGAEVGEVAGAVGGAPGLDQVAAALARLQDEGAGNGGGKRGPLRALFATHVDTSTGVRLDPSALARLAREAGLLSVFDGVCATAGESFAMAEWEADVYLTASQKALSLPPGLALLVASPLALSRRNELRQAPPTYLDWQLWLPVMRAYEERKASYFSTPATNLILALEAGLSEILTEGVAERIAAHRRAARALRAAWNALGLVPVPEHPRLAADTLSALRYPAGTEATLLPRILARGVSVAGPLHPALKGSYFRVGHMGYTVTRPDLLRRAVEAIALALADVGVPVQPQEALDAFEDALRRALTND